MSGVSSRAGLALGLVLLAGGCVAPAGQAPDVGQAELLNESGRDDLTVVVVDTTGRDRTSSTLDEKVYLDTQWVDRELQCLVAEDGRLEVRSADGVVVARHEFADRPVCEHDVIVLGADGSLTWR